ncbi:hypothetical protein [Nitrosomonas sp. Is37]|uniref:hypothetical protein n=1 Tax=Nitrosomonas sp. Is37 TaxID=3080535 RepID=UPI00294AD1FB|nr:hypothetical protein [Nitrosomonas sp. Is37]MDV6343917.1 hypothetical protein [Nitrosomonas sp. Is37]
MRTKPYLIIPVITAAFIFLIGTVHEAAARIGGGGGGRASAGGARAGGGGARAAGAGFSRSGAAASGSFSYGSSRAATGRAGAQAASASRTASRSQAAQTRATSRAETREGRQGGYTERTDIRQQERTARAGERTERAGERTERVQARADTRESYAGRYYDDHGHYHDDDDWDDGEVAALAIGAAALGAMGGYVAGQSTATPSSTVVYSAPPSSGYASLPCAPYTTVVQGVTYYQCGSNWYTQAYGGSGVTYMPVPAPY